MNYPKTISKQIMQGYSWKKSLNLFQILEMIYCKPFISVKKWGEVRARSPECTRRNCSHFIWHTNQRFCTILHPATKGFAEAFSVDQAFKLGDFYVTVTFRNPILINKEGTHPRNSYWSRINSTEEAAFVI